MYELLLDDDRQDAYPTKNGTLNFESAVCFLLEGDQCFTDLRARQLQPDTFRQCRGIVLEVFPSQRCWLDREVDLANDSKGSRARHCIP